MDKVVDMNNTFTRNESNESEAIACMLSEFMAQRPEVVSVTRPTQVQGSKRWHWSYTIAY